MKSEDQPNSVPFANCPACGSSNVRSSAQAVKFKYGNDSDAVELSATVPSTACMSCGEEFLDDRADRAKHDAVCEFLGVLKPSEIAGVRGSYGLTRADFASLTGLGEATLGRWERGLLIQNVGNDRYIRLLRIRDNIELLKKMTGSSVERVSQEPKFRSGIDRSRYHPAALSIMPRRSEAA